MSWWSNVINKLRINESIFESDFDKAIKFVFKWEGGFIYDSDDPGGETSYGISKKYHSDVDIKALTADEAKKIYKKEYWLGGDCQDLPWPINLIHFDACV